MSRLLVTDERENSQSSHSWSCGSVVSMIRYGIFTCARKADSQLHHYLVQGTKTKNKEQELRKCWDKRPGRITVNSKDKILPIARPE